MAVTTGTTEARGRPAARRPSRLLGRFAREAASWPTILLVALVVLTGVPLTVALTPAQDVYLLGQHVAVGARTPDWHLSGPARLVQIGNTQLDIPRIQVWGPLRPQIELGPVQRNADAAKVLNPDTTREAAADAVGALRSGFVSWYLWGALGVAGAALALSALVGCARMLAILRRESRAGREPATVADVWHACSRAIGRMTIIGVTVALAAWGAGGALAYDGTMRGLAGVRSLTDLVGATRAGPEPVGPPVFGYAGAVIGDSRVARVGGPPISEPEGDDVACERSADSLAAELQTMVADNVANLACSGATVAAGLLGPQQRGDVTVAAQVGLLKQLRGLDFVVVAIGPNDIGWSDFLRYCYGVPTCDDNLTTGEFDYRMAAFDRDYAAVLAELAALPDVPRIIVMTSYGAFPADTDPACPDARGPGVAVGLDQAKIDLLTSRNSQLNAVLRAGAEKYGFAVADPALTLLCSADRDGLGADIQGLSDSHPFHPTGVGSLRLAATVARLVVGGE